jgi:hypothetical protein
MKKLYLVILITFLGCNLKTLGANTQKNQTTNPEFIKKDISKKRKELKSYKKKLKKMKKNNTQTKEIAEEEKKIKDLKENLQREERTSTSFFLQTSDMTDTRSTMDSNNAQDIHHAKYFDDPLDAVTDIHDKNSAYFRNH